jgi:hypothetical protein
LPVSNRVLAERPDLLIVHNNRGTAFLGMMRREEALAAADVVLRKIRAIHKPCTIAARP